jgi:hypothetical protein
MFMVIPLVMAKCFAGHGGIVNGCKARKRFFLKKEAKTLHGCRGLVRDSRASFFCSFF